ncbi:hypothetical protein DDT46_16755 [Mycobacteroides abscessus]|nr:hypothetical protein DDT46_16755 [Mycobacteroides abscessus]
MFLIQNVGYLRSRIFVRYFAHESQTIFIGLQDLVIFGLVCGYQHFRIHLGCLSRCMYRFWIN